MHSAPDDRDFSDLERDLAALAPCPSRTDRDRLMFLAGQASVRRLTRDTSWRAWLWPSTTAAASLVAVALGVLLIARQPEIVTETVYIEIVNATQSAEAGKLAIDAATAREVKKQLPPESDSLESPRAATAVRSGRIASLYRSSQPNYLQARELVLALGVEALPAVPPRAGSGLGALRAFDVLAELGVAVVGNQATAQ